MNIIPEQNNQNQYFNCNPFKSVSAQQNQINTIQFQEINTNNRSNNPF